MPVCSVVEKAHAVVIEVQPDEAAVFLDKEVCLHPGRICARGRALDGRYGLG